MNGIFVTGKLVTDAELTLIQKDGYEMPLVSFTVCDYFNLYNEANYFEVRLLKEAAANIHPYLVQGKQVTVSGKLRNKKVKTKDGFEYTKNYIAADIIEFGDKNFREECEN